MADKPKHDDGTPIICERGYCGISPNIPADMEESLYYEQPYYSMEDEINGVCERPPLVPTDEEMYARLVTHIPETGMEQSLCAPRDSSSTLTRKLEIEFIHFGKSDIFPAEAFSALGPVWRLNLIREWKILLHSIEEERANHQVWLELRNTLTGMFSELAELVAVGTKGLDAVPITEYDGLWERASRCGLDFLIYPKQIEYWAIHEAGVEMYRIREAQQKISVKAAAYRERVIGAAATSEKIASTTEWIAFKFNDQAAKLAANMSAKGNPLVEAAYRLLFVVVPKTLGHAIGVWTSELSDEKGMWYNDERMGNVIREARKIFISDGSGILTDLLLGLLPATKGLKDEKFKNSLKTVVRVFIENFFYIVDAIVIQKKPEALLKDMVVASLKRVLTGIVKNLVFAKWKDDKAAADACGNAMEALFDGVKVAYSESQEENINIGEALISNAPFIIVGMLAGFAIGFTGQKGGSLDKWARNMKSKGHNTLMPTLKPPVVVPDAAAIKDVKRVEVVSGPPRKALLKAKRKAKRKAQNYARRENRGQK